MSTEKLTFDSVRDVARQGLMSENELRLLHRMATSAKGEGVLVEVGSWVGTSALVILAGQHEADETDVRLFCIDIFEHDTREGFERNLSSHIESGDVTPLIGDSLQFAADWPTDRKIKLLFLDGDHRYKTVKAEVELFTPHLLPGAVVAFHDAYYRNENHPAHQVRFMYEGASRAIRELVMADPRFSHFERAGALLVCRFEHPEGTSQDHEQERAKFVDEYYRCTAIHTWPLRIAYSFYHLTAASRAVVRKCGLECAIRSVLRLVGVRRMFGTEV